MGVNNTTNVRLGVCDVTFNGVDLGATKGGVEVQIQTSTYQSKIDQYGETPIKEIITGTEVTVKVPMAETALSVLATMMPQADSIAVAGTLPTATVGASGAAAVNTTDITLSAITNVAVGQVLRFAGHTAFYQVTTLVGGNVIRIRSLAYGGGLIAPIANTEAITWTAGTGGVIIRPGVNVDMYAVSQQLKLHPTGLSVGNTEQDFTLYKAAPMPNFTFKYELAGERVYEVTFKAYPDQTDVSGNAKGQRLAAFGALS